MYLTNEGHVVRALTIAGSDSGGGAGIQADLKTFAAFGVYGMSVLTGLTAQNTVGVQGVRYVDPEFVVLQLSSVFDDLGVDALKTGMLGSSAIIQSVANFLRKSGAKNLVVDPVMIAKGGESLMDEDAKSSVVSDLIPLSAVLTPNIPEAAELCGFPIQSWEDSHKAARQLVEMGASSVVIKGGHAQEEWLQDAPWRKALTEASSTKEDGLGLQSHGMATDIIFDGKDFTYLVTPRVPSKKTHGTGCTFSSAITASLAKGAPLLNAMAAAKGFIYSAIASAQNWDVGAGHGPTDHSVQPPSQADIQAGGSYLWSDSKWEPIE